MIMQRGDWVIHYEEGRVFSSTQGSPFDAPRAGVQIIVQQEESGYRMVYGRDHFYWEEARGGWQTSDIFGAIDHLMRAPRQCLLFGRQLSDADWRAVEKRVRDYHGERKYRLPSEPLRDA